MPTDEQKTAFIEDYKAVVLKHKLDFVYLPVYVPVEDGNWALKIIPQISSIEEGILSPFIANEPPATPA